MKKITRAGQIALGLGVVLLIYNFFKMYSLVGDCPNGSAGCSAYSSWHLLNAVAVILIVIGIITMVFGRKSSVK